MSTPERQVVEWIDAYGNRYLQVIDSLDTGGTDPIVTQLALLSNAQPFWRAKGPLLIPGGAPVANQWPSVFDRAELLFGANIPGVGAVASNKLVIPAPHANIFYADGETVQPLQCEALRVACVGVLRNASGGSVLSFFGGIRIGTGGRP